MINRVEYGKSMSGEVNFNPVTGQDEVYVSNSVNQANTVERRQSLSERFQGFKAEARRVFKNVVRASGLSHS
jgi:hypothetical protein